MNFQDFKKLRVGKVSLDEVWKYLTGDLVNNFKELDIGLKRLSFQDNFESFEWTGEIAAGAEAEIPNMLRTATPTRRIVLRSTGSEIVDGDTEWSRNYVYLKNTGVAAATVTAVFLK